MCWLEFFLYNQCMLYIEFLYDICKLCSSLSDLCELGFCCSLKNILLIRSIVHVCSSLLINLLSILLYILFLPPPTLSPLHIHSHIIDTSICVYTYVILSTCESSDITYGRKNLRDGCQHLIKPSLEKFKDKVATNVVDD